MYPFSCKYFRTWFPRSLAKAHPLPRSIQCWRNCQLVKSSFCLEGWDLHRCHFSSTVPHYCHLADCYGRGCRMGKKLLESPEVWVPGSRVAHQSSGAGTAVWEVALGRGWWAQVEEPAWTVRTAEVGTALGNGLLTCGRQSASNRSTARRGTVKISGSFLQTKHSGPDRLLVPSQSEWLEHRDGVLPLGRASAEGLLPLMAHLIPVSRVQKLAILTWISRGDSHPSDRISARAEALNDTKVATGICASPSHRNELPQQAIQEGFCSHHKLLHWQEMQLDMEQGSTQPVLPAVPRDIS